MSTHLFIINNDDGICGIYTNLEKAKHALKIIYNKSPNYKHYEYQIHVYLLMDNEFILTEAYYSYDMDKFILHND
jgi:hypothetical protein